MLVLAKIVVTAILIGASAYVGQWLESQWPSVVKVDVVTAVIGAVAIILADYVSTKVEKRLLRPLITVQTSRKGGEIDITINVKRGVGA